MVLVGKVKVHVCTDAVLYRTVFSSSSYKRGDQGTAHVIDENDVVDVIRAIDADDVINTM